MRHVQLHIADIFLAQRPLPLRHGTIQVVERDGAIDWEIVLHTIEAEPVSHEVHPLEFRTITGVHDDGVLQFTVMSGQAALVRWIDTTLVFRGTGDLVGFSDEHFPPPPANG